MANSRYDYIVERVKRPQQHGYRVEPKKLPFYLHLTITEEDGRKYLTVHSKVHVEKEFKMPTSYSSEFSDWEIISDQSAKISKMFLS